MSESKPVYDTMALLGDAGAPYTITSEGKKYKLSRVTYKVKAQYEAWIKSQAYSDLAEMKRATYPDDLGNAKPVLTPQECVELSRELQSAITRGDYAFESPITQGRLTTQDGVIAFLKLLLEPNHPDITDMDVLTLVLKEQEQVKTAMKVLHPEIADQIDDAIDEAEGAEGAEGKKS